MADLTPQEQWQSIPDGFPNVQIDIKDLRAKTNAISYIPQDIKADIYGNRIRIKAGTKIYIPNGPNTFNTATIQKDMTYGGNSGGIYQKLFVCFYANDITKIHVGYMEADYNCSGPTDPVQPKSYAIYYNTTENKCKTWLPSTNSWVELSLPVAAGIRYPGGWAAVDQVFNGFAYVGTTIFILPGVKVNIPKGRTPGTTNPISQEVTISSTKVNYLNPTANVDLAYWINTNGNVGRQQAKYIEYDQNENKLWQTVDDQKTQILGTIFADVKMTVDGNDKRITQFNIRY